MATKTTPVWEITKDDRDWSVKRKTDKTVRHLICTPSKGVGYFEDEHGKIINITTSTWDYFVRDMPTLHFRNSWVGDFNSTSSKRLFCIVTNTSLLEMIGKGYLDCLGDMKRCTWILEQSQTKELSGFIDDVLDAYRNYSELLEENKVKGNVKAMQIILSQSRILKKIEVKWGVEEVKDFIERLSLSPYAYNEGFGIYENTSGCSLELRVVLARQIEHCDIPVEVKNYSEWRNFIINQYYFGYSDNLNGLYVSHEEIIKMQRRMFGYVPVLYPEHILGDFTLLQTIQKTIRKWHNTKPYPTVKSYDQNVDDARYSEKYLFKVPVNLIEHMAGAYYLRNDCLYSCIDDVYDGIKAVVYIYNKEDTVSPTGSLVIDRINKKIIFAQSRNNTDLNCIRMAPANIWFDDNKDCFKAKKGATKTIPSLCLYREQSITHD